MTSKPIRSFTEMLQLLDRGKFDSVCNEALNEAIETLEDLPSQKGKATLTMQITLSFDQGRIDVRPAIKSKLPEARNFADTPFWSYDGALSVQHPSQIDMFVRPAPEQPAEAPESSEQTA